MARVRLLLPTTDGKHLLELFDNPKWPQSLGGKRFPGGGIETGETPEEAAVREAKEEFGKDFTGRLVPLGVTSDAGEEHHFRVDDHGLSAGSYEDAAGSGKITLIEGEPGGDSWVGTKSKVW